MRDLAYPGGLDEIGFLEAYHRSALVKPQVVADMALRAHVFAQGSDRLMVIGVIAEQAAEAARRLLAVYAALADRRYTVARALLGPLPGPGAWQSFIQDAATLTPEQMLRHLGLDEMALESANRLRGQPDLHTAGELVAADATGSAMLLVPWLEKHRVSRECWLAGTDGDGGVFAAQVGVEEEDAARLADLTADLSSIARGFLGAYLGARLGAGRRD
jgi:hypothetical protein